MKLQTILEGKTEKQALLLFQQRFIDPDVHKWGFGSDEDED